MTTSAQTQLQHLQFQFQLLVDGQISTTQFADAARQANDLLAALPDRFSAVLPPLLNSLEAGAAFQEESCSFDQGQLHQNLSEWLRAAASRLSS